jgi:hypothetical protein
LGARNRAAKTIGGHTASARQRRDHALEHDHDRLDRRLLESYLAELADRVKPPPLGEPRAELPTPTGSGNAKRVRSIPIRWRT